MGLFSGDTVISVASSTYNLAGPEDKRPNYLKTTIASGILTPQSSISDTITNAYLSGPGVGLKSFGRWADSSGYNDLIGMTTTGKLSYLKEVDITTLATQITHAVGSSVIIQTASIGRADYSYWADQYMVSFHRDLIGSNYTSDFDGTTVTIILENGTEEQFEPIGFNQLNQYIYATYALLTGTDTDQTYANFQLFIYGFGSGDPILDGLFATSSGGSTYLPVIPLRINNTFVSGTFLDDVYPLATKALKKAIGAKFDDLISKLNDNPQLADIDYAYVVFGVSLNTQENSARRYIYNFFQKAMAGLDTNAADVTAWLEQVSVIQASRETYLEWLNAQQDPLNPLHDTPPPFESIDGLSYPPPPTYTIRIASLNRLIMNYDITITWSGIVETVSSGLSKPDAKVGELWWDDPEDIDLPTMTLITSNTAILEGSYSSFNKITLHWQTDASSYKSLTIYGLVHNNSIYNGKSVVTGGIDALRDGSESGFIIPLDTNLYQAMSLIDATQMSTACSYMIVNAYQKKTVPWYATGFFQIFITVLIIAVAVVVTVYTGGAATPGLLGTAGAVGASLGATGTAAVIIGAAVNAVAAMIAVQIITQLSTAVFGNAIGSIIGTITAFATVAYASGAFSGLSSAATFNELTSAQSLIKLSSSLIEDVGKIVMGDSQQTLIQAQNQLTAINGQTQDVQSKYEELTGPAMIIDPLSLTGSTQTYFVESPDDFFSRTLMTGSDIAGTSLDMVTNFADLNLRTDLPI